MKPKEFDTVRLLAPLDNERIGVGAIGVIVTVFDHPDDAYEVELSDQDGATVALVVLKNDQFEIVTD